MKPAGDKIRKASTDWVWNLIPLAALLLSLPLVWRGMKAESLQVVPSRIDLGRVPLHEYQERECVLRNGTRGTVTFWGCTSSCNSERCLFIENCPERLARGEEWRVRVSVAVNRLGPFRHEAVFFNDYPHAPRVVVEVVGTAVERN